MAQSSNGGGAGSNSGSSGGPNGSPENERFVIVSNRGPVSFSRSESGEREFTRGAGGLVTALNAVSRRKDTVWIASATSEEDVRVAREEPAPVEVEDLKVTLVEHDAEAYDLMYNHLANPLLWFVQHGLYDLPYAPELGDHTRRAWEKGYLPVNRNFAEAVVRTVEGGASGSSTIMLHDYQLYMTPLYIRERLGPEAFISLFVHTPWPETDYWRVLPKDIRVGILESLLSADVLAFHTHRYAQNFLDTVAGILGVKVDYDKATARRPGDGREVWVRAYPISIDPAEFEELSESEGVLEEEEQFVKPLSGKLLLRVDRTDLSKNIVRGFKAYGRMFERYPEMQGGSYLPGSATALARRHPRVRPVHRSCKGSRKRGQRAVRHRLLAADSALPGGQLPPLRRRLQELRCPAGQRRPRRDEPRRQRSRRRQRAERRPRALGECRSP